MLSALVIVLLPMVAGYLVPLRSKRLLGAVARGVNVSISVILLLMGISLAALENMVQQLSLMSGHVAVLFVVVSVCNLVALGWLSRRLRLTGVAKTEANSGKQATRVALTSSFTLVGLVVAGAVGGHLLAPWLGDVLFEVAEVLTEWVLYLLLALIGCQLRNSGLSLRQILFNRPGLAIALTMVASSLLGGLLAAPLLSLDWHFGMAMAAGFGWYSLSGILIAEQLGPLMGGVAFFNDLFRELMAFILIPLFMQRHAALPIGYSGATSVDVTLPVIQQHGGIHCVPVAVVSGFLLSLASPPLILFFLSMGG